MHPGAGIISPFASQRTLRSDHTTRDLLLMGRRTKRNGSRIKMHRRLKKDIAHIGPRECDPPITVYLRSPFVMFMFRA